MHAYNFFYNLFYNQPSDSKPPNSNPALLSSPHNPPITPPHNPPTTPYHLLLSRKQQRTSRRTQTLRIKLILHNTTPPLRTLCRVNIIPPTTIAVIGYCAGGRGARRSRGGSDDRGGEARSAVGDGEGGVVALGNCGEGGRSCGDCGDDGDLGGY